MSREKYLTVGWNNALTLALGLVVVVYILIVVFNSSWSEISGFTGLAILGAFY